MNIIELPVSENMTVEQCLDHVKRKTLKQVLVIGIDENNKLITRSSKMVISEAVYLLELAKYGLLPEAFGWFPEKIHTGIDAIILGMHAKKDNLELLKAQELGLKVYSYPEYIYEQSKDKIRVVQIPYPVYIPVRPRKPGKSKGGSGGSRATEID